MCSRESLSIKCHLNNTGSTLVVILVMAVVVGMIIHALSYSAKSTLKKSGQFRSKVSSLNIAEAGKESFYAKLRNNSFMPLANSDSVIFSATPFADGNYTVICQTDTNPELLTIRSTGTIRGETISVEITARFGPEIPVRKSAEKVGGAITSRYKVDLTGSIHVDGNDYDSLFIPIGSGGVYEVWTCMQCCFRANLHS